ncbi:MAG: hypothetical protein ACHQAY_05695 [Hyphomicrobiales bacterium]
MQRPSSQQAAEATTPTYVQPRARAREVESAARDAVRDLKLRLVPAALGTLAAVFSFVVDRDGPQGASAQIARTLEAGAQIIASLPVPFG